MLFSDFQDVKFPSVEVIGVASNYGTRSYYQPTYTVPKYVTPYKGYTNELTKDYYKEYVMILEEIEKIKKEGLTPTGWQCPLCKRVIAPQFKYCNCERSFKKKKTESEDPRVSNRGD